MPKNLILKFLSVKKKLSNEQYLYSMIAYHIAPTMAGNKPASLVTLNTHGRNMYALWQKYKYQFLHNYQITFYELRKTEDSICILFYNPEELMKVLTQKESMDFLKRFGYHGTMTLNEYLNLLKERFENVCPHEMGIFLGFPIKDVISFIECSGKDCLFSGHWKVYHDPDKALETFKLYEYAKMKVVELIIKEGTFFSPKKLSFILE